MVYSTPSYLISLFEIRLILLPMYGALILLGACVSLARDPQHLEPAAPAGLRARRLRVRGRLLHGRDEERALGAAGAKGPSGPLRICSPAFAE